MAVSPDTFVNRPMIPIGDTRPNVADHYLGPRDTTLPYDFREPSPDAFNDNPGEQVIYDWRRDAVRAQEQDAAEHTGNYWLP